MKKWLFVFICVLALFAVPALAQAGDQPKAVVPLSVAAAVAIVIVIVQFVKEKIIPGRKSVV